MTIQEAHYFLFTKSHIAYEQKKEQYDLMRLQSFLMLTPHLDKKKCKSPLDLIQFPWEDDTKPVPVIEYTEEMFQGFDALFASRKKK